MILGVLIYGLYGINHSLASPDKRSQRLRPRERPNTLMLSPVPISSIPTDIGSTGANYATPTFDLSSNERRSIIKNKTRMPSRNENKEWKYMFSLREMFLKSVFIYWLLVSTFSVWSPLKEATLTWVTKVYNLLVESSSSLRIRAKRTRTLKGTFLQKNKSQNLVQDDKCIAMPFNNEK